MAAPRTTVWEIEPHTRAKHAILRRYLQAWTPILTLGGFPEVVYVDGFAGPGRYSAGEDGSPVIALRVALDLHAEGGIDARIRFLFVEKDPERARMLEEIVVERGIPREFRVEVARGETFEVAIRRLLDSYTAGGRPPPPIFAFIDPFGWTGAPFSVVREIMSYRSCEVFVTFMYEEINRFIGLPDQEKNFDSLFGTGDWRAGAGLSDARERNRFFHGLYQRQLRDAAAVKYVRSFEMRNERDVVDYYLFYATNNRRGLEKMKDAMWRVNEAGEFQFSDATDPNQAVLFEASPNFDTLRNRILERFGGREATVAEIEEFVLAETAFRETHYKRVLKPLERDQPPMIEVIAPPPGRRTGTYRDKSLRLRFRPAVR